jgi:hypothetical protein
MPTATRASKRMKKESKNKDAEEKKEDLFAELDRDCHRDILSFLITTPKDTYGYSMGWQELKRNTYNLMQVSKLWYSLTSEGINQHAPVDIVSSSELASSKGRAYTLDLTSIRKTFVKDVKEKWGDKMMEDEEGYGEELSCLGIIVNELFRGNYERFADTVCEEYLLLIVVKCLEILATNKIKGANEDSLIIKTYKEKCMPSKLVDVFWHSHMLSPKKYSEDCKMIIGEIIDHDSSYVSAEAVEKSDLDSKKKFLFKVESQAGRWNHGDDREHGRLFEQRFTVEGTARDLWENLWEDMNGYNDCG